MCEPVSIGMGIMAVAGSAMSSYQSAKATGAAIDAQNKQKIEMVKQMNYQEANLRLQERDTYEDAVNQLSQQDLTALRNQGMVRAAIQESNLEGNSMDRIQRITDGDDIRSMVGITENYRRDYSAIFGNRIANVENTKSAIKGMAPIMKPSRIAAALDAVSSGAGAYTAAGGKFGTDGGGTKAPISQAKGTSTGHS